jgi:hypothetical protein
MAARHLRFALLSIPASIDWQKPPAGPGVTPALQSATLVCVAAGFRARRLEGERQHILAFHTSTALPPSDAEPANIAANCSSAFRPRGSWFQAGPYTFQRKLPSRQTDGSRVQVRTLLVMAWCGLACWSRRWLAGRAALSRQPGYGQKVLLGDSRSRSTRHPGRQDGSSVTRPVEAPKPVLLRHSVDQRVT